MFGQIFFCHFCQVWTCFLDRDGFLARDIFLTNLIKKSYFSKYWKIWLAFDGWKLSGLFWIPNVFPHIVSSHECFLPLNSFRGQNLIMINSVLPWIVLLPWILVAVFIKRFGFRFYEVIGSSKIPTKNYRDFRPTFLINFQGRNLCNFWLGFWKKRCPHKLILKLTDI